MRPPPSAEQRRRHDRGLCVAPGCTTKPGVNPTTGKTYWMCWDHANPTVAEPKWQPPVELPPQPIPGRGRQQMRNRAKQRAAFKKRTQRG